MAGKFCPILRSPPAVVNVTSLSEPVPTGMEDITVVRDLPKMCTDLQIRKTFGFGWVGMANFRNDDKGAGEGVTERYDRNNYHK